VSIDAISQGGAGNAVATQGIASIASTTRFSESMQAEFDAVNSKLVGAEAALRDLATGKQTNLHHVMLELEEAKLSFHLLSQVRNKVLEAYQELMRTQI
jgi:flagellar hook-basal body complex protein FliE